MILRLLLSLAIGLLTIHVQASVIDIEHWQTPNGVRVYFVKASHLPIVDIKLLFSAGSAYDGNQFGLATLTNELLDQGANKLSANDIAETLESNGAILGTSVQKDYAEVSLRSLSKQETLSTNLGVLKALISKPTFTQNAIAREKAQLITAIRHSNETPQSLATKAFYKTLYGTHPYAHPVIGNEQTITSITQADVKRFYQTHYASAHTVLTIVGNLDKTQAKTIALELTNQLPKNKLKLSIPNITAPKAQSKSISYPSNQTILRIGQLGINYQNKQYFPLIVGNYTLGGGGLVSRLADEIREKRGLSYGISSYFLPLQATGPFIISLATKTAQAKEALNITKHTLNEFVANGPNEKELEAAKRYMIGSFPLRLSSNKQIVGLVSLIGFYQLPLDYLDNYTTHVKNVSIEDIKSAFKQQLSENLLTIVVGKS